ncbi:MAG: PEP-CTERM sorting domain-containing protein [Fimbriimonadaceae bacterium]|nr:PEP-CTERM sorting domain-containing protein [Fimbriimonadaceae bacterium]
MNRNLILIASALLCGSAFAQTEYNFSWQRGVNANPEGLNDAAGRFETMQGSFNRATNTFSFYGSFSANKGVTPDGFWLVISPGPNPKGHSSELAIFYLDASAGKKDVYAYSYNGANGNNSFKDGSVASGTQAPDKIYSSKADPSKMFDVTSYYNNQTKTKTLGFSMDATVIQNHVPKYGTQAQKNDWTGAAFGEEVGIWWHPVNGLSTSTSSNYLTKFEFCEQGWFDGQKMPTNPVPEPATMVALGAGLLTIFRRRKVTV